MVAKSIVGIYGSQRVGLGDVTRQQMYNKNKTLKNIRVGSNNTDLRTAFEEEKSS
jgi:hypothetical protein